MGKAIQLDLFNDPVDMLVLELQQVKMQQAKIRRSMFARLNEMQNEINKLIEFVEVKELAEKRDPEKVIA